MTVLLLLTCIFVIIGTSDGSNSSTSLSKLEEVSKLKTNISDIDTDTTASNHHLSITRTNLSQERIKDDSNFPLPIQQDGLQRKRIQPSRIGIDASTNSSTIVRGDDVSNGLSMNPVAIANSLPSQANSVTTSTKTIGVHDKNLHSINKIDNNELAATLMIHEDEIERLLQLTTIYGSIPPLVPRQPTTIAPTRTITPATAPVVAPSPTTPTTFAPSQDKSCLIGETPETYLYKRISAVVNDTSMLLNPNVPQGVAFNFTLDDALVNDNICTYPTIEQRYSLAVLYYSTGGPNWFLDAYWLTPVSECQWLGVVCKTNNNASDNTPISRTDTTVVPTTTVSSIVLASNNLIGTIPDEVNILSSSLNRIDFYNNKLSSTLPLGMQKLTSLVVLDLEDNVLNGNLFIDSPILQLTSLQQLFVSSNKFTGTIPSNISDLQSLSSLWIANNLLSGSIPTELGLLLNMFTLILYENDLVGTIPTELGLLTNLTNVQLYGNILEGTIPDELFNLNQLEVLRIDRNFCIGTISSQISNLNQLIDLRINDNFFAGTIPEAISSLSNLEIFLAGTNAFNGTIPNVFSNVTNLQDIDLSNNVLTGPIPDTIFDAVNLTLVYLNNNNLTGTIPSSYSSPTGLIDLYLNSNQLTGTVPDIADGALPELTELLVQMNNLDGSIPSTLCDLRISSSSPSNKLENLFSDCGGPNPSVECSFPDCCNRCFDATATTSTSNTSDNVIINNTTRYRHHRGLETESAYIVSSTRTNKQEQEEKLFARSSSSVSSIRHRGRKSQSDKTVRHLSVVDASVFSDTTSGVY